jgi:hypothetical protein
MKAIRLLDYGGQLVFNDVPTPAGCMGRYLLPPCEGFPIGNTRTPRLKVRRVVQLGS